MVQQVMENAFQTEISTGVVLVDFYADWCGPCKMMAPVLDTVAQEVGSKAKILKLDIEEAQGLAVQFKVTSIPTLVLFKNGKEVSRVVGLQSKDALKKLIDSAS